MSTGPRTLLNSVKIPGWAVLPLRLFLGISFLWAGLDKLFDPSYLDPAARDYIGKQIARFAVGSPLEGFLTGFAVPNANLFGVLVMGGEICIGLATILGLLTRFSAFMGLLINLTFFLSATWDVRPFYFGADLPYLVGWLTLVLAGPGIFALDPLVARWITPPPIPVPVPAARMRSGRPVPGAAPSVRYVSPPSGEVMSRRAFLGGAAAGLTGLVLAATGLGWGILHPKGSAGAAASVPPSGSPTQVPAPPSPTAQALNQANPTPAAPAPAAPTATTATAAAPAGAGPEIAAPGALPVGQMTSVDLPSGDPAILVHLDSGYKAYSAICTHRGCLVSPSQSGVLVCPCHGAEFDPTNNAEVLAGPARSPLPAIPITVAPDGAVYLQG